MMADAISAMPGCRRVKLADWRTLRIGGWRWRIRPDRFEELQRHPVLNPGDAAAGDVIKRGPQRTVCRFRSATTEGSYYLKLFHPPDWRTRWKQMLRGGQARWEFSRYRLAVERGLPTPDVMAVGRHDDWSGESALITRGIEHVAPLDEWLRRRPSALPLPQRRRLAEQLGELIARMHAHGVHHRDLHAGNLLINHNDDGQLRLWVVDLAPLRFHRHRASPAVIGQNLGRLRHSLLEQLSLVDQAAFFQAYWRQFSARIVDQPMLWQGDQHSAWRELSQHCEQVARRAWNEMDRAWARGNSKEILITLPNIQCRGLARLGRERLEAFCRSAAADSAADCSLPISDRRVSAGDSDERLLIVSRSEPISPETPKFSWARRCWEIGHALECRWIAAPVPVFMIEHRTESEIQQQLAFAQDRGWKPLAAILTQPNLFREIFPRVIDLLQRLHELGFTHASLGLAAFEVQQEKTVWKCRFALLDDIRQSKEVSGVRRCADLQPLAAEIMRCRDVSRTLLLRWLMRYLGRSESIHWKTYWRMISPSKIAVPLRRAA